MARVFGAERRAQMFAPATAIRAPDILSRNLLDAYHPLAAAQALLPPGKFAPLARQWLIDVTFPWQNVPLSELDAASRGFAEAPDRLEGASPRVVSQDVLGFAQALEQRTFLAFLNSQGLTPDQLLAPPAPPYSECLSCCPRCRAQFRIKSGTCADCGGLQLIPFSG
ncbi:MAG TPA: hypothetical protein VHH88_14130 [Verrucomicrobiae bacterium]|nr:hypothetical protein [Verrucomicrobiae bacterium]